MKKADRFITYHNNLSTKLSSDINGKTFEHLFEELPTQMINTAIACNRPLLLTGEPGVGKTQLARAAAKVLKRVFVRYTVDAKTEPRDLLWRFDAVARLADAQIGTDKEDLEVANYIRPGPLWWGVNWGSAKQHAENKEPVQKDDGHPDNGAVVLIDEIDKAEIDVPNGLLEVLGDGCFQPEGIPQPVRAEGINPLVIITSNRERTLPDAFIRRCVVYRLEMPSDSNKLKNWLIDRGRAHSDLDDKTLEQTADLFVSDREEAVKKRHRYLPGQAEYLDLLRVIEELAGEQYSADELIKKVSPYILLKGASL